MPTRGEKFIPACFYHLYNRGNNREKIFFTEANYLFFIKRVKEYLYPNAEIIAYCLMPNHYHILIRVRDTVDSNSISQSMKRLSDSYTKAINKAYNRTGSIFEGCYKPKLIETTDQLIMNIFYIHTNPVKNKLVDDIDKWPFSNYWNGSV